MIFNDIQFLQRAITVARQARENGNHPFGAILVNTEGNILLEAENTVVTDRNCTGHAETNLMRQASQIYDPDFLAGCTLYTSTEPCPMCSGAIFWGNVRRVVYGLSQKEFYKLIGNDPNGDIFYHPCRDVFAKGQKPIEIVGPLLKDEAIKVHEGFWG
jgi:tRNA(Arg) A34 adenosine deaminase TadA